MERRARLESSHKRAAVVGILVSVAAHASVLAWVGFDLALPGPAERGAATAPAEVAERAPSSALQMVRLAGEATAASDAPAAEVSEAAVIGGGGTPALAPPALATPAPERAPSLHLASATPVAAPEIRADVPAEYRRGVVLREGGGPRLAGAGTDDFRPGSKASREAERDRRGGAGALPGRGGSGGILILGGGGGDCGTGTPTAIVDRFGGSFGVGGGGLGGRR